MTKIFYLLIIIPFFSFSISEIKKEKIRQEFIQELENDSLSYKAMLIIDTDNNEYYSYNKTGVRALASLTKLMNAKLIINDIKEGKYNYETKVLATKNASKVRYGYRIKENIYYSVEDLLNLLLLNSSNSAAYLLAEFSSSLDINSYINRMNEEAKKLNLKTLKFSSPNGLAPLDSGFSKLDIGNARDLAKLALNILKEEKIIDITKNYSYFLENGDKITSTNPLIENNSEIMGLKTGYHSIAKYNIINYFKYKDKEIIQVILGSKNIETRTKLGKKLLDILKEEEN